MSCRRIRKRLSAFQDGEIGREERERIAAHLGQCAACRSAYAGLGEIWQSLERIPEIQVSAGFEGRLFEGIDAAPEPRAWWQFPWVSWVYRAYPAPAMAAVVLLVGLVLGGYLGNTLMSGFSPGPAPIQVQTSRATADYVSFRAFSAAPPGTLGERYLALAHFTEDDRR